MRINSPVQSMYVMNQFKIGYKQVLAQVCLIDVCPTLTSMCILEKPSKWIELLRSYSSIRYCAVFLLFTVKLPSIEVRLLYEIILLFTFLYSNMTFYGNISILEKSFKLYRV